MHMINGPIVYYINHKLTLKWSLNFSDFHKIFFIVDVFINIHAKLHYQSVCNKDIEKKGKFICTSFPIFIFIFCHIKLPKLIALALGHSYLFKTGFSRFLMVSRFFSSLDWHPAFRMYISGYDWFYVFVPSSVQQLVKHYLFCLF